jgi:ribonuclease HI
VKVVVHFDGGCRTSTGCAAGGAVVFDESGKELAARGRFIGRATTPEAEYAGLILGLETALELGATEVDILGDAELIVRHVDGRYRCRKEHLIPLLHKVWLLGGRFEKRKIREFPKAGPKMKRRFMNERADELANMAMDRKADIVL